MILQLLNFI